MKSSLRLAIVVLLCSISLSHAQNTQLLLTIEPSDTPASPLIIKPGETVQFTAKAFELTAGRMVEVQINHLQWDVDPASFGSISSTGLFTAATQNSSGRGYIVATATVDSHTIRAAVSAMLGQPVGDYTFKGNVSSAQGPIPQARVSVMGAGMLPFMVDGRTDAQGNYSIDVPGGEYYVRAEASGFIPEFFDNAQSLNNATKFVTDPNKKVISDIDFVLGEGGTIEGYVIDAADNTPIAGASVFAFIHPNTVPPSGTNGLMAVTNSQGFYQITGIPDGSYYVSAEAREYHLQYFDEKADLLNADQVHIVSANTVSNVDFALNERQPDPVYTISGTVYDAKSNPVADANVFAEMASGPMLHWLQTRTKQDGTYELKAPSGTYVVWSMAQGFVTEYYDDKPDAAQADRVTIDAANPAATGIDFTLGEGGSISGTVLDAATGQPLENVAVNAFSSRTGSGNPNTAGSYARTDAQGHYLITGLPTGDYTVQAQKDGYASLYYDDVADATLATPVAVVDGQETQNINFDLGKLPGISGTVTDAATGDPIERAIVVLDGPNSRAFAYTDAHGNYHLATHAGSYKVHCSAQGYTAEWYDDVTDIAQAATVTVPQTGSITDIDFALDKFGGSIAGEVKDAAGSPIAGAFIAAWSNRNPTTTNPGNAFGKAVTANDGSYLIEGLPPGDFVVRASAHNFIPEYYDNKTAIITADEVTVTNQRVTGIDFALGHGGTISGTVTDEDSGDPLMGAFVKVRAVNQRVERGARTDSSGDYVISGLPSDDYVVFAAAVGHMSEYYDDAASTTAADQVTVTAPGTVADIDFALATSPIGPRRFTGNVVARGGGSPQHVLVEAIDPVSGTRISTTTDAHGAFDFFAWNDAIIRARALGFVGMYAGNTMQWKQSRWEGFAGGMTITLDPVVDNGMAEIRGYITDASSGDPLVDAWVYGINAAGQVAFSVTGTKGGYLMENISNGSLDITVSEVLYEQTLGQASVEDARGNVDIAAQRSAVTSADENAALPAMVQLYQNYPNPFNPSTTIRYTLPHRSEVTLRVFNLLGEEVLTLVDGMRNAGEHSISLDATDLTSGIYLYRLDAAGTSQTRRMTLVK